MNRATKLTLFGRAALWSTLLIAFDLVFVVVMLSFSTDLDQLKLSRLVAAHHDHPTVESQRARNDAFAAARRKGLYLAAGSLATATLITAGGLVLIVRNYRHHRLQAQEHPTQVA